MLLHLFFPNGYVIELRDGPMSLPKKVNLSIVIALKMGREWEKTYFGILPQLNQEWHQNHGIVKSKTTNMKMVKNHGTNVGISRR